MIQVERLVLDPLDKFEERLKMIELIGGQIISICPYEIDPKWLGGQRTTDVLVIYRSRPETPTDD